MFFILYSFNPKTLLWIYFLAFLTTLPALLAMGLAGAGFPVALAALRGIDLMFLRGLVLTTACTIFLTGALVTFLMASLFSKTDRSVLAILGWGKFHPAFVVLALRQVPYRPSSFLKADSVQMQNLPTWPPGASFNKFRLSTCIVSTPGMFLNALVTP